MTHKQFNCYQHHLLQQHGTGLSYWNENIIEKVISIIIHFYMTDNYIFKMFEVKLKNLYFEDSY